jgi:hypothetical protein
MQIVPGLSRGPLLSHPPILPIQCIACLALGGRSGMPPVAQALNTFHSDSLRIWSQGTFGVSRPVIVSQ